KDLKLTFVPRKGSTLLCGLEVVAGGEIPVAQNVVHTDLTVPESMVLLKPVEEPRAAPEETSLRSFLWVGAGAALFMWIFYRFHLLARRAA
ncbi:MAG: hypothetical protein HY293_09130, partial [Planctomycetes bacterium]|nr:hypothetical protein [Planctomycetota bacterium]